MGFAEKYLAKQSFRTILISRAPENSELLKYIVIIPAYSEPEIQNTLQSILNTHPVMDCIEVYMLINYPEHCSDEIKAQNNAHFESLSDWSIKNSTTKIHFNPLLAKNLPGKHAGAGLARKLLMDWACKRFEEVNMPDGIIFSLDADTIVPKNYFTSIEECKQSDKKASCYLFNFAHPTTGNEFTPAVYDAITQYELHLRYYRYMLRQIGFPYFQYTVGSCFAIEALTYVKAGGMNKRKAGEDFYFLQKVFPNNKTVFLSETILIPSARPSWRVPFGTGPTVRKITGNINKNYKTYNPKSFFDLETFLQLIPQLYKINTEKELNTLLQDLPDSVLSYLNAIDLNNRLKEIKQNSASEQSFEKRFYQWFDAFNVIKYLNKVRERHPDIEVNTAVTIGLNTNKNVSSEKLLEILREMDRKTIL